MNKRTLQVLVALSLVCASSFAAKERVVRFQNHVRVGYDDNIYQTQDGPGSAFITDIVNLSAKLNFSSRTDALLYWQPEFLYRFDADPKFVTYQDLYGRLNHAVSQRAFLTLSDRFRYQIKEGQTGTGPGGGPSAVNQNYFENDLLGALDYTLTAKSYVKVGGGYEFRVWDDETYGKGTRNNDYDQLKANGSYIRQIKENKTQGLVGLDYINHTYNGDRGGFDSIVAMLGVDQNFNANFTGYGRAGLSFSTIDGYGGTSQDSTNPYLQAGLSVNPTARTSYNGSLGYSLTKADNSIYNAQDQFSLGLGVRHSITAKISLAGSLAYTHSIYDAKYSNQGAFGDATDDYVTLSARCSYQVNRNNFVEAGYLFGKRASDFTDYDRNGIDLAWRLRL